MTAGFIPGCLPPWGTASRARPGSQHLAGGVVCTFRAWMLGGGACHDLAGVASARARLRAMQRA